MIAKRVPMGIKCREINVWKIKRLLAQRIAIIVKNHFYVKGAAQATRKMSIVSGNVSNQMWLNPRRYVREIACIALMEQLRTAKVVIPDTFHLII